LPRAATLLLCFLVCVCRPPVALPPRAPPVRAPRPPGRGALVACSPIRSSWLRLRLSPGCASPLPWLAPTAWLACVRLFRPPPPSLFFCPGFPAALWAPPPAPARPATSSVACPRVWPRFPACRLGVPSLLLGLGPDVFAVLRHGLPPSPPRRRFRVRGVRRLGARGFGLGPVPAAWLCSRWPAVGGPVSAPRGLSPPRPGACRPAVSLPRFWCACAWRIAFSVLVPHASARSGLALVGLEVACCLRSACASRCRRAGLRRNVPGRGLRVRSLRSFSRL